MATFGYAGKILRVDLTSGETSEISTMQYADRFLGGMGVAAKIYWDEVPPEVGAYDPENRLICMNGPLAGFGGVTGSRWIIAGKCPTTTPEHFASSNLGGRWGAQLKFAGYDGIVIQGRATKPVYLFVEEGVAQIRDASALWGKGAIETRAIIKNELGDKVAVAACGPAGENLVTFANVMADNDASGSSGFGAVMGSKNLKAIAVRGSGKPIEAKPEKLREVRKRIRELWTGLKPLDNVTNALGRQGKDPCYGCIGNCPRGMRVAADGTQHKAHCGPSFALNAFTSMYYGSQESGSAFGGGVQDVPGYDISVHLGRLIDDIGLDMGILVSLSVWLCVCSQMGLLTDEDADIPLSKFGSQEFFEALVRKIALRDGFGDTLAQGIWKAADLIGGRARELLDDAPAGNVGKDGRGSEYCPRSFPAHALIYALEPTKVTGQVHEMGYAMYRWLCWADKDYAQKMGMLQTEGHHVSSDVFRKIGKRFWGSELAADFSTYEGKALAVKKIKDREFVKESLGLCDWVWPILNIASGDYIGDPSVESKLFSAVTGNELDEEELDLAGERICNLRRALRVRERGNGRESDTLPEYQFRSPLQEGTFNPDCLAPGKDGEIISLKGTVVDQEKLEGMKDEYYQLRGWDVATGLQTRAQLDRLGMGDIADDLEQRGLLV